MNNLKNYRTVAERLHAAITEIASVEVYPPQMLDEKRGYLRVRVSLKDGRWADGSAGFVLGMSGKSAQATSPIEDAETSAVGRALAFLGWSSDSRIASEEEIAKARAMEENGDDRQARRRERDRDDRDEPRNGNSNGRRTRDIARQPEDESQEEPNEVGTNLRAVIGKMVKEAAKHGQKDRFLQQVRGEMGDRKALDIDDADEARAIVQHLDDALGALIDAAGGE